MADSNNVITIDTEPTQSNVVEDVDGESQMYRLLTPTTPTTSTFTKPTATTKTTATTSATTSSISYQLVPSAIEPTQLLQQMQTQLAQVQSPNPQQSSTTAIATANNNNATTTTAAITDDSSSGERSCWICFATDEDNRLAAWVQPCKCRGTTKWVHQACLYRWVDEKQKGNALRSVTCQQCQTEYIIVFPQMSKVANVLETCDNLVKRLSPFLAAGIFVGSLYWTAVTYGAVTFLQVVGPKKGFALMDNGDPLILLIGLPAIPVVLVLGRMIRWEDAVIRLIRNRRNVARKLPLMNFIIPCSPEESEEQSSIASQSPATPALSDPVSATRIFCGALLLPTISSIVGRLLFDSVENVLHRTLLGGLTFITVKGILKIYLKQQQFNRKKKRRIVDYTEENIRHYLNRSQSRHQAAGPNNGAGGNGNEGVADVGGVPAVGAFLAPQEQQQQALGADATYEPQPLQQPFINDSIV